MVTPPPEISARRVLFEGAESYHVLGSTGGAFPIKELDLDTRSERIYIGAREPKATLLVLDGRSSRRRFEGNQRTGRRSGE